MGISFYVTIFSTQIKRHKIQGHFSALNGNNNLTHLLKNGNYYPHKLNFRD